MIPATGIVEFPDARDCVAYVAKEQHNRQEIDSLIKVEPLPAPPFYLRLFTITVRRYSELVRAKIPVRKIVLYGSYTNNCARKESDIDGNILKTGEIVYDKSV